MSKKFSNKKSIKGRYFKINKKIKRRLVAKYHKINDWKMDPKGYFLIGIDKEDKDARRAAWRAEGIKLCIEQIQEVREIEGVAGVQIMAIEWEAAIKPIVEGAGLLPRPIVDRNIAFPE